MKKLLSLIGFSVILFAANANAGKTEVQAACERELCQSDFVPGPAKSQCKDMCSAKIASATGKANVQAACDRELCQSDFVPAGKDQCTGVCRDLIASKA